MKDDRPKPIAAVLRQLPAVSRAKARLLDEAFLDTEFAPWQMPWGEAFAWATGHDSGSGAYREPR